MKLLTTISIITVLGLNACNSNSVDLSKTETEEKVIEEKATDNSIANTTTEKTEIIADEPNEVEKQAAPATEAKITDTYWKLIMLEGKAIEDSANPHDQPHFMLNTKDNRVTGNDSCNGFFGNYTLAEGNRIKFDQLGGTKRYCPDTVVDQNEFMQMFGKVDRYRIRNVNLELYTDLPEPLAVFEAVSD